MLTSRKMFASPVLSRNPQERSTSTGLFQLRQTLIQHPVFRMTSATLLTGMTGTGKSTILNHFQRYDVISLDAQKIQATAVDTFRGRKSVDHHLWSCWDAELQNQAIDCLEKALIKIYPGLRSDKRQILASGTLLVKDWFREAFEAAIANVTQRPILDLKYYLLHLDAKLVIEQISKRNRANQHRYLEDPSLAERDREGYLWLANKSSVAWEPLTARNSVMSTLRHRIGLPDQQEGFMERRRSSKIPWQSTAERRRISSVSLVDVKLIGVKVECPA